MPPDQPTTTRSAAPSELFSLDGKVALVTGGGQGIGREIARCLRAAGASIVIGEIADDRAKTAADELGGMALSLDVTDPRSVAAATAHIVEHHGRIDILVNNAGIAHNVASEDESDEGWRQVMAVNLDGLFWCCRDVGRVMLRQGGGSIVNIASMSGLISNHPQPQAAYNASKAAVIMLTKSLAGEWAQRGVRVNSISPAYVATALLEQVQEQQPNWVEVWMGSTPMGRPAQPAEIGPAALYLASDASSYVTGSNLVVDGGYTVW
jgi:NAD(P)-dependent dehydrogenase (short-subunit alcohol dehydrogenase family)